MTAAPLPAWSEPNWSADQSSTTPHDSIPVELESVDCLLCGGRESDTIVVAADPLTGLGRKFRVVRCSDCGLHFTNPRPTVRSIGQFYPDDYACWTGHAPKNRWRHRLRHTLEQRVLQQYFGYPAPAGNTNALQSLWGAVGLAWINRSDRRQNWIPWRGPGRLLDFGCGAGDFLVAMRRHGWTVEGMDMSPTCAAGVRDRTGIPVHVGSLPDEAISPESFDAVTMWNSLEHVHEPRTVMQAAREALRPGWILVVGVPNIASWSFRQFQQEWFPLKLPRHLTHFTPLTLQEMAHREGFRVLALDHIARPHFLRKSARQATSAGWGPRHLRLLRNKRLATPVAKWTERTRQADFIRLIAERID